MKITENTSQRLVIISRRKIIADIIFAFFLGGGAIFTIMMAGQNMLAAVNVFALFMGLLFVAVGVWGLFKNAADHVALDATTRTLTITRRTLLRSTPREIAFSDLADVRVHSGDECQTVAFILADREEIPLETAYSGNPKAAAFARQIREWLQGHDDPPVVTPLKAT
ncbi:hypothetical protein [Gymnodinialimonas ulvae]|uniref:hypothetical protein n=1 Tax=Gymnodinialimonas ulvae TaxID=3126504 RepID=UPI0030A8209A